MTRDRLLTALVEYVDEMADVVTEAMSAGFVTMPERRRIINALLDLRCVASEMTDAEVART